MTANRLLETIVDTTAALIVVLDAGGRIVLFNKACENLSGYRFEEVRGRLIWDFLLLPEEAAGVREVFENLRAGQFPNQHKNHWVSKSGELRLTEWSNSAVTDESGRVIQIIGTGIDITQRELTEQQLRAAHQRQQALLDSYPDAAWLKDTEGRYVAVNKQFYDRMEDPESNPIGKTAIDIFGEPGRRFAQEDRQVFESGQPTVMERQRIVRGKQLLFTVFRYPVLDDSGKVVGVAGVSRDITDSRSAEERLNQALHHQKALLDSIPDAAWLKDSAGRYVEVNQNFLMRHKIGRADILGRTDEEIWGEKSNPIILEDRQVMSSRQPFHLERLQYLNVDAGEQRWLDATKTPVLDDHGNVIGLAGVSRDITERKLTVQALNATLQSQKALLDSIPDAAWLKDGAGRYVEVNQVWLGRHNLERAEVTGKTDLEILPGQNNQVIVLEDREVFNSRQPLHLERPQYRDVAAEDPRWLEIFKTLVLDDHGNVIGIASVSRDITDRKRAEHARLKRDAGLRAALIREVNHRIKNNLQSVMALLHQHSVSHPEIALIMQKAIAHLNAIATVHGLHASADNQDINLRIIINALATSMWGLHSGTPIEVETAEDFVAVQVANSETVPVALIITELIRNAVKHSPAADPGKPIRIQLARTGPAIRITISNPGAALPAAFDFARGSGLGTGLQLIKSLMPPTGADICFEAAAQTGITVTLTLSPPVLMATDKPQITDGAFQHG